MPKEAKAVKIQRRKERDRKTSKPDSTTEKDGEDTYRRPANVLAAISLFVSALAFVSSLRSCQVAQNAQELTQKQYREERLLVLDGEFNKEGDEVKLKSTDGSMVFLEGRAYFPKLISDQEWSIRSSDKTLYLTSAKYGLQKFIAERVPKKKGYAQYDFDGKIPLLIDAYYTSKGDSYLDRSLYMLSVEAIQSDKEGEPPSIKFTGLLFIKRFPSDAWDTARDNLEQIFEKEKGLYIPPKAPE